MDVVLINHIPNFFNFKLNFIQTNNIKKTYSNCPTRILELTVTKFYINEMMKKNL